MPLSIDFNDRYEQARTLGRLRLLAGAREDWAQAVDYTLQAAAIFAAYEDPQFDIALRTLAGLRQAGDQLQIVPRLAEVLGISVAESEALLARFEETEAE